MDEGTEAMPDEPLDLDGKEPALMPAPQPAPFQQDKFLAALVEEANVYNIAPSLTLCVGGLLITGDLTSTAVYLRAYGEEMERALSNQLGREPTGEYAAPYREMADAAEKAWANKRDNPAAAEPAPTYICLENARYFNPSGGYIPVHDGMYWRGKISAVDGFSLGRLSEGPG